MNSTKMPFRRLTLTELEANFRENGKLMSNMDVCGFFLCQRGWVKIQVGRETYTLRPGDVCLYTPSSYITLLGRSDDVEGMAVKSTLDVVIPFAEKSLNATDLIMLHNHPCFTLSAAQQCDIEALTRLIEAKKRRLWELPPLATGSAILRQQLQSLADSFFQELLYAYFVTQNLKTEAQDRKDRVLQAFILSLMRNYKKEREVAFYAAEQHLSPRYFSSVIRERTGHTASEWIVNMVISGTSQLLAHSNQSIKSIAIEFNFATQSFFGKYFKQATGLSPKEYRLRERNAG